MALFWSAKIYPLACRCCFGHAACFVWHWDGEDASCCSGHLRVSLGSCWHDGRVSRNDHRDMCSNEQCLATSMPMSARERLDSLKMSLIIAFLSPLPRPGYPMCGLYAPSQTHSHYCKSPPSRSLHIILHANLEWWCRYIYTLLTSYFFRCLLTLSFTLSRDRNFHANQLFSGNELGALTSVTPL
jgi:hypothetical protein